MRWFHLKFKQQICVTPLGNRSSKPLDTCESQLLGRKWLLIAQRDPRRSFMKRCRLIQRMDILRRGNMNLRRSSVMVLLQHMLTSMRSGLASTLAMSKWANLKKTHVECKAQHNSIKMKKIILREKKFKLFSSQAPIKTFVTLFWYC